VFAGRAGASVSQGAAIVRRHSSFLLRCWDLGKGGEERIEIEHIQSGTKVLAKSVEAAVEWICARDGDTAGQEKTAFEDAKGGERR
jgi:hypothetical protein